MPRSLSDVAVPVGASLAVAFVVALLATPFAAARADTSRDIASVWRDREIRIDGVDEEWRDLTVPVKGQRFAAGFVNDADALYICIVTKDRVTATQIERQGLIVWLNRANEKKRTFGIQYPVDAMRRRVETDPGDVLAILGPGRNDVQRAPMTDTGGIRVAVGVHGNLVVYELKVPLQSGGGPGYTLKAQPGDRLRVELQTPEWRGPAPIARGPVGIGVGVRPGPGGPGIMLPPVDGALLKPLDVTGTLTLATEK
ncbi:MAG TPA: hypothetical protein VGK32_03890 [Vicinamibacterales bacterium]